MSTLFSAGPDRFLGQKSGPLNLAFLQVASEESADAVMPTHKAAKRQEPETAAKQAEQQVEKSLHTVKLVAWLANSYFMCSMPFRKLPDRVTTPLAFACCFAAWTAFPVCRRFADRKA